MAKVAIETDVGRGETMFAQVIRIPGGGGLHCTGDRPTGRAAIQEARTWAAKHRHRVFSVNGRAVRA